MHSDSPLSRQSQKGESKVSVSAEASCCKKPDLSLEAMTHNHCFLFLLVHVKPHGESTLIYCYGAAAAGALFIVMSSTDVFIAEMTRFESATKWHLH